MEWRKDGELVFTYSLCNDCGPRFGIAEVLASVPPINPELPVAK